MIRRTFFQLLSGLTIPPPRWCTEHLQPTAGLVPKPVLPSPANPSPDPEWLTEWLRLPRLPLLWDDLAEILDLDERSLVALILVSIRLGEPFNFQYFGGSEPGKHRHVLPVLLFTTALDDMPYGAGDPNPIYLLAWCQSRHAPRTFRLDRVRVEHSLDSAV
jgi:hypothetical protein